MYSFCTWKFCLKHTLGKTYSRFYLFPLRRNFHHKRGNLCSVADRKRQYGYFSYYNYYTQKKKDLFNDVSHEIISQRSNLVIKRIQIIFFSDFFQFVQGTSIVWNYLILPIFPHFIISRQSYLVIKKIQIIFFQFFKFL